MPMIQLARYLYGRRIHADVDTTGRELAALPARWLAELLPNGWAVSLPPLAVPEPSAERSLVDQAPDGRAASLAIEVKAVVDARDVSVLADRAARRTGTDGTIVAGRYASPASVSDSRRPAADHRQIVSPRYASTTPITAQRT